MGKTKQVQAQVVADKNAKDLSPDEQDRLGMQEARIQSAQESFFELVDALRIIEDEELYRPHGSLSAYAKFRWDMSDSQVTHYRSAWVVLRALEAADFDRSQLPKNEGQTRALARRPLTVRLAQGKYDTKRAVAVWKKLIKSGNPITAAAILKEAKLKVASSKSDESADEGEESPLAEVRAKATARNIEGTFIQVVVKATQEQADMLNGLLNAFSMDEQEGTYVLIVTGDSVESVFVRFGAFVTEHKITQGAVSFIVK